MTINVSCSNGHSLKLKPAYAGRKVKCPTCHEVMSVPIGQTHQARESSPVAKMVRATCQNGHQVRLKQKYAGRRVKCPKCQNVMKVPGKLGDEEDKKCGSSKLVVSCPNGHILNLNAKYAGKLINCPSCQAAVQLPQASALFPATARAAPVSRTPGKTIVVRCSNNHALNLPEKYAGQKVKCPKCTVAVLVPILAPPRLNSTGTDDSSEPRNQTLEQPLAEDEWGDESSGWNDDSWDDGELDADSSQDNYSVDSGQKRKKTRKKASKKVTPAVADLSSRNRLFAGIGGTIAGVLLIGGAIWWFEPGGTESAITVASPTGDTPEPTTNTPAANAEVESSVKGPVIEAPKPPLVSLPPEPARMLDRKLKAIAFAMHHHHDDHRVFAPPTDIGSGEKSTVALPLTKLSWRVHLLPYLNEQQLYDQFHLDEPWDSEHNLTLMEKMPSAYRIQSEETSNTRFLTFAGPGMVFNTPKAASLGHIDDEIASTLAVFVTGIDKGVPWTKPDEFTISEVDAEADPVAVMGQLPGGLIHCAMLDTKRLILPRHVPGHVLRALATRSGNELVNVGNLRAQYLDFVQNAYSNPGISDSSDTRDVANTIAPAVPSDGTDKTLSAASEYEFVEYKPPATDLPEDVQIALVREKLARIALAFQTYSDVYTYLNPPMKEGPEAEGVSSTQRNVPEATALSWRVHLLPYLGYAHVYSQFKLDEPWDSDHNSQLLYLIPEPFRLGMDDEAVTNFRVLTGANMMFGNKRAPVYREISDGRDRTLIAGLASTGIPWTCPDSLRPGSEDPASFFKTYGGLLHGVMVDATPVSLSAEADVELLKAIATPRGQESIDATNLASMHEDKWRAALQGYREQASEESSPVQQKLLKIGTALQLQFMQFGSYSPPRAKDGDSSRYYTRLSWRVHLLPFLGEGELYSQFQLDEPWNSPRNARLLNEVPDVFRLDSSAPGQSHIQVVADEKGLFPAGRTMSQSKSDGMNQTVLCIAVGPQDATPWTRPGGIGSTAVDAQKLVSGLQGASVNALLTDMSLISFPAAASAKIKNFLTATGKDYVDGERLKRVFGPFPQPLSPGQKNLGIAFKNSYQDQKNLGRVSSAMISYHDVHGKFPVSPNDRHFDESGRSFLSWRVHLLPFLDQKPLYDRFKLDEPWDSAHNRPLVDLMPAYYRLSDDEPTSNTTRMVRPVGEETANPGNRAISMNDITDNKSHVIHVITTGPENAIPWTAPRDIAFDPQSPRSCLGKVKGSFLVATASGGAFWLRGGLPSNLLKAMMTIAGREKMPPEFKYFKR